MALKASGWPASGSSRSMALTVLSRSVLVSAVLQDFGCHERIYMGTLFVKRGGMMSDAFEQLLSDLRRQLERMRARPQQDQPPAVGVGQALDGKVKTAMAADGRLLGMVLDPAVLRMDERDLARVIVAAVNQAWAARQGLDEPTAAVAGMDPAVLQRQLSQLQDKGLDAMRRFTDGMQAVLDKVDARVPQ
ncbi:MAG TPA: YbaB/EbfC family nucleoid-associated protein [Candidatus Limnocylindrales bacterium]|nr:YbaB/EbfC family nucleoid-associated protein [Candidatus Limnocylindrales bacterium]